MLSKLQEIRDLLTTPDTTSIGLANQQLQQVAEHLADISSRYPSGQPLPPDVHATMTNARTELAIIAGLSQTAAIYFGRMSEIRAGDFGAYERNGVVRSLGTPLRVSVNL